MNPTLRTVRTLFLVTLPLAAFACDIQESPGEEAKEVVESVKNGDDLGSIGEEAGEVFDAAGQDVKEGVNKIGDKAEDAWNDAGDKVEDAVEGK